MWSSNGNGLFSDVVLHKAELAVDATGREMRKRRTERSRRRRRWKYADVTAESTVTSRLVIFDRWIKHEEK